MNMTAGEKIKRLRIERDLDQRIIAYAADVTTSAVSSWETGRSKPNPRNMYKLSQYFGLPESFFQDDPCMPPSDVPVTESRVQNA